MRRGIRSSFLQQLQQLQQRAGARTCTAQGSARAAPGHLGTGSMGRARVERRGSAGAQVGHSRVHVDRGPVQGLAARVPVVEDAGVLAIEGRNKDPRGTPRECPQSLVVRLQDRGSPHMQCKQYSCTLTYSVLRHLMCYQLPLYGTVKVHRHWSCTMLQETHTP